MEKIFTERAHLMCPCMCFGIAAAVNYPLDKERLTASFDVLAQNHPFLRSVIGYDAKDNGYFYDVSDESRIALTISDEVIKGLEDPRLIEKYKSLTGYDWNIMSEGLLKVVSWGVDSGTVLLFVFHHLLADGRGAMDLASEFADVYVENRIRCAANEKLIESVNDMPENSKLPFVSKMLVDKANRDWTKEGKEPVSYTQYHEFADSFVREDKTDISMNRTSSDELGKLLTECRDHSVTLNDYLMAKMFTEDRTDKIIIAKDIRDSLPSYNKGSLGNYSTAFSIEIKNTDRNIWTIASEVHKKVQRALASPKDLYLVLQCYAALNPAVLDCAFMAAKGAFESRSAGFIGKMFFGFEEAKGYSITNLGKIDNKNMTAGCFIPPASPAIRKTVGVLTVNGEMVSCICER